MYCMIRIALKWLEQNLINFISNEETTVELAKISGGKGQSVFTKIPVSLSISS